MKIDITFPDLRLNPEAINSFKARFPKTAAQELLNTRTRLQKNIQGGRDSHGGALRKYSPGYAAWKQSITGSSTTNLTLTGELIRSMQVKEGADGAELYFLGQHAPARPRAAANTQKKRGKSNSEVKSSSVRAVRKVGGAGQALGTKQADKQGGGASVASQSNADLARSLDARGFSFWFELDQEDITRFEKTAEKLIEKVAKDLIVAK